MDNKDFLTLSDADIDLILEALDHYKNKWFPGYMMKGLLKSALSDRMSPEKRAQMEKEDELEQKKIELEKIELSKEIDLVRSKIVLIRAERESH